MKKEAGPYFHLSFDTVKIEDLFDLNLGFYKIPTMAYYGDNYPYGDPLCIIRCDGNLISFPQAVTRVLQTCETVYMTYPPSYKKNDWIPQPVNVQIPEKIEFYWVVSDVTDLKSKGQIMNLVNHAWAIRDFSGGRKVRHIPNCIVPICGVQEVQDRGVKFGQFRAEYMSMHFKKGCLSLSPNNHRVFVSHNFDICKFWTISISDFEPKAIVTLQWIVKNKGFDAVFRESSDLQELIYKIQDPFISQLFGNITE